MSKYDTSKETTKGDVAREAGEAKKEVAEAVDAVKALASGGTVATAAKQLGEAVDASADVAVAAVDLVVDQVKGAAAAGLRFFKSKLGYTLHDPDQNRVLVPHKINAAEMTPWMEARIKEGIVHEVSAAEAEDAARGPLVRDELSR